MMSKTQVKQGPPDKGGAGGSSSTTKQATYAEIAPAIPLKTGAAQTFTYRLSASQQAQKNSIVNIPLGKRVVPGVVLDVHHQKPTYATKPVKQVRTFGLNKYQLAFARWIAETAHGGLGFTLRLFLPPAVTVPKEASIPSVASVRKHTAISLLEQAQRNEAVLTQRDDAKRHKVLADMARWYASPSNSAGKPSNSAGKPSNTAGRPSNTAGKPSNTAGRQGSQTLIIVPEVWMLKEFEELFAEEMKSGAAATFSASHTTSQQTKTWHRVFRGECSIVIGTQKALFLPFQNLGLVALEEAGLPAHKLWDQYPRLDNRVAARKLAQLHDAHLVHAGSFPSVAMQYAAQHGAPLLASNPEPIPFSVIALTFEDRKKKHAIPEELHAKLRKWLKAKERVLVFLGRKSTSAWNELDAMRSAYGGSLVRGTAALFTLVKRQQFDHVVWLNPERSLSYPDYRSHERALVTLARLHHYLRNSKDPVTLVTRVPKLVDEVFGVPIEKTMQRIIAEREKYSYPPATDMVRLTWAGTSKPNARKQAREARELLDKQLSQMPEDIRNNIRIRGPFYDLRKKPKQPESHILLTGPLERLPELYRALELHAADVAPHRVV